MLFFKQIYCHPSPIGIELGWGLEICCTHKYCSSEGAEPTMDDLEHLGMHIPINGKMNYKMYTSLQVNFYYSFGRDPYVSGMRSGTVIQ